MRAFLTNDDARRSVSPVRPVKWTSVVAVAFRALLLTLLCASVCAGCGAKTGLLVCGVEAADFDPDLDPIRPIAPWSTTHITSHQPAFAWVLPRGADGADVRLCRDRACAVPVIHFVSTGTSARSPEVLGTGVWFWQLRDRVHGRLGCRVGPVWEFFVGPLDTAVDTSQGVTMDIDRDGFDDVAVAGSDGLRWYWVN